MAPDKVNTGGLMEIFHTGEEKLKDTPYTTAFKKSLNEWREGEKHKKKRINSALIILLSVIIILSFLFFFTDYLKLESISENKTITEIVPAEISILEYIKNKDALDGEKVSIESYLGYKFIGQAGKGWYSERLVDDYGNEIELKRLKSEYKILFEKGKVSEELYEITGTFNREYDLNSINVQEIKEIESPTKTIVKQISSEEAEEENEFDNLIRDLKLFFNEITSGLSKITKETKEYSGGKFEEIKELPKSRCALGYIFQEEKCIEKSLASALDAFDYMNQFRKENGRSELKWDERAYNLAVSRSKDMFQRNYFDHVTPEGTCAKDMKSSYGFSASEVLAENAGGVSYYIGGGPVSSSRREAVDGWISSRGHRYNLLYPHKSGAIGCYNQICIFFGVHTDPYGLGAGPCTTGAEGLAAWETIGKQPGEI